jgi:hypothetical protein
MRTGNSSDATFTEVGHRGLEIGAKAMAVAGVLMRLGKGLLEKIKTTTKKS